MVQIDPGGAVASTFRGADPDAVIMATGSKDNSFQQHQYYHHSINVPASKQKSSAGAVPHVVVEAFESRHIVDELRDDGGARSTADEPSQNVIDLTDNSQPRSSVIAYRGWPVNVVASKELIKQGEQLPIVLPDDRGKTDSDEVENQRFDEKCHTAGTSTKTSAPNISLQPHAATVAASAKQTSESVAEVPKHGSSFFSTICACFDPTYGYDVPAPTASTQTAVPPLNEILENENVKDTVVDRLVDEGPVDAPAVTTKPTASFATKLTSPPKPEAAMNLPSAPIGLHDEKVNILNAQSEDDEGSNGENLLNLEADVASVPSVHEDVADSVAPMAPDDLPCSNIAVPSSASEADIVEENYKVVETSLEEASQKSKQREKAAKSSEKNKKGLLKLVAKPTTPTNSVKMDEHLNARRRILTKELRSVVATYGRYDLRCANVSAALGDVMDEARDYGHAVKLHRDAVSIFSCKLGDDHSTTLQAKMRLGMVLENSGDIEQAINLYYQVTVMRKALRGEKDASVGEGLVCMARALRKKEDYIQAIKELKRALKIFRQSLGDADEKVSSTVDEIASLYITIGDFAKSAAILEEVVKLKAATLGPRSNQVGSTLLQLASAYECAGEQANAIRSLKKAYKIFSETGGFSGEDATTTLNRMAMLYEATKDHNRAAVAYLGVLRSKKIQYGAQNTAVGETYFHLGRSLRLTGQFDKSLKCLKEALPIFVGQGAEVDDVKMVADIMHEMAMVNQDRGNYVDSARIFKQELSVRRKIGQPNVPFISRTLLFMGIADYSMKNFNQALKHLVEALSLFQERGDEGLDCAKVLYYTGLVFEKVDNSSRAIEALAEAIRLFEENDVDADSKFVAHAQERIEFLRSKQR